VPQETKICYIHRIAMKKVTTEEPIPFAGMIKFVEYVCPMCQSSSEDIRVYKTEIRKYKVFMSKE
jgi:C4-type Zn-finger protein